MECGGPGAVRLVLPLLLLRQVSGPVAGQGSAGGAEAAGEVEQTELRIQLGRVRSAVRAVDEKAAAGGARKLTKQASMCPSIRTPGGRC